MLNLIFGILLIVLSAVSGYFAWKFLREEQYDKAVWIMMGIGFLMRIFIASDPYLHKWDESFHALVAKNIMSNPLKPTLYKTPVLDYDYRDWTANHVWLHKPPLPLWIIGISLAVFGDHALPVRLPSILFGVLGIWLIYLIGSNLFDKKAGTIAAYLFSINGLILELTSGRLPTDHVDIFFMIFVLIGVYRSVVYLEQRTIVNAVLVGFFTGFAVLCKWLPGLIVIPVWMVLTYEKKDRQIWLNHFFILIHTAFVIFLPWLFYTWIAFPQEFRWEQFYNWQHITKPLIHSENTAFYHWRKIQVLYGAFSYLPLIYLIVQLVKKKIRRYELALLVWFLIPYIFFTFVQTRMAGYTLFAAPALFLMTGLFYNYVDHLEWLRFPWLKWAVIAGLLLLPLRFTIERLKPFQKMDRNPVWVREMKKLPAMIPDKKVVIFNEKHYVNVMFYTGFIAYEKMPTCKDVIKARKMGYTVYVHNPEKIPMFTQPGCSDIHYISLTENKP